MEQCPIRSCRQSSSASLSSRALFVCVVMFVVVATAHAFVPSALDSSNIARRHARLFHSAQSVSSRVTARIPVDEVRKEWVHKSVTYYSKVSREERRCRLGQVDPAVLATLEYQTDFETQAKRHYFALCKIRQGKPEQAELIYRRIIEDIKSEHEEECDNAKLAVTTLLLALHLQRNGNAKETRSVFLNFFRQVLEHDDPLHECTCSAKVLQAFALFEMKQGNALKSLDIVHRAVRMDKTLRPVLNWKQFRDVREKKRERTLLRKLRCQQASAAKPEFRP